MGKFSNSFIESLQIHGEISKARAEEVYEKIKEYSDLGIYEGNTIIQLRKINDHLEHSLKSSLSALEEVSENIKFVTNSLNFLMEQQKKQKEQLEKRL